MYKDHKPIDTMQIFKEKRDEDLYWKNLRKLGMVEHVHIPKEGRAWER